MKGGIRIVFKGATFSLGNLGPNAKFQTLAEDGSNDSGGYVKFTPKYIIVGGEGGYHNFV